MPRHLTLRELLALIEEGDTHSLLDQPVYAYCCNKGFHRITDIEGFAPYNRDKDKGLAIVIDETD